MIQWRLNAEPLKATLLAAIAGANTPDFAPGRQFGELDNVAAKAY
jgi:hypothetical protein